MASHPGLPLGVGRREAGPPSLYTDCLNFKVTKSTDSASETVKDWRERAEAGSPALSRREGHSLGLHLLPVEGSAIEEACSPICISNSWRVDEAIHSAFCVLVLLGMGCCLAAGHGSLRLPESAGPLTHTAFKTRIDLLREVSDAMVSPRHR